MHEDYLVLKWDDIEHNLSDDELNEFYGFLDTISFTSPEVNYTVLDSDKPYVVINPEVANSKEIKITKEELLAKLKELSQLNNKRLVEVEVEELLVDYINDKEISDAYEDAISILPRKVREKLDENYRKISEKVKEKINESWKRVEEKREAEAKQRVEKRLEKNLELVEELKKEFEENPSLRFIQALWSLGIISRDKDMVIEDRFYEEPDKTLMKLKEMKNARKKIAEES